MKRKKVTDPGKGFAGPLVDDLEYYYKKVSYDEVFRKARNDIDNIFYSRIYEANELRYELTVSADGLIEAKDCFPPDTNLTRLLQFLWPTCPDLFQSKSPGAIKLAAHFDKLRWDSNYARTPQERKRAQEAIRAIIESKTPDTKWKKKPVPPLLSLNDMYAYLHRITEYLQEQYINEYGRDPLPEGVFTDETGLKELREIDPRLEEMVEKDLIPMLIKKPKELTRDLMAQFLGLTPKTLKQELKKEKKPPVSSPPQKR